MLQGLPVMHIRLYSGDGATQGTNLRDGAGNHNLFSTASSAAPSSCERLIPACHGFHE